MNSLRVGKQKDDYNYGDLVELLKKSDKKYDLKKIDETYQFALRAHGDQKRKSGKPFIMHPISVACILVELGMDNESIMAALLHDVVEDTPVALEEVKDIFGEDVALITDGVTKLGKIPFSSREEQQAENLRKMLIAMSHDIRVIIVKLADRLHNLRTIEFLPEQKRRDKALETMEVYAPIADRLGIKAIKEEMEDLSLSYLDPIAYKEINDALEAKSVGREEFIAKIKEQIGERVKGKIDDVYIDGRVKSINGIYKKVYRQGRSLEEIYDIYAVRLIVDSVNDCYNALGIIHDLYTPIPNRFKDYISTPKRNFYQSLHTTVLSREAIPFEVQIRTWKMHRTAEYGIAAHWKYKLGITKQDSLEKRVAWIRQIIESQQDAKDATDIMQSIKTDIAPEEVFVFTPRGDVLRLPLGSTVIDFAYSIHTSIGNRMIGAKVDGRIVPIDYKVKTGQIIDILTTKEETRGPSRDWLSIVKTTSARNKIRNWFKKKKRDENIIEGKNELEREFKRNNIILTDEEKEKFLSEIAQKRHCSSIDDLYASIGYGGLQIWKMMPKIKEVYTKVKHVELKVDETPVEQPKKSKSPSGIIVDGLDDCLIKFSKCCNPLPGDDVIGFITRGHGVSVHKRTCPNVPKDISKCGEPERWIKVHWDSSVNETFESNLSIVVNNRTSLLADITTQLSNMHIFINGLNSRDLGDNRALININITVNGIEHLRNIINKLLQIDGIVSVGRS